MAVEKKVSIPLASVEEPWKPVTFRVRCALPIDAQQGSPWLVLKGLAFRLPEADGTSASRGLKAFCMTCPHELCDVRFVAKTRYVKMDRGRPPKHPLLVCSCHLSVYDPLADGAVISGPAQRGAFRFAFDIVGDRMEITAVEEKVAYVT